MCETEDYHWGYVNVIWASMEQKSVSWKVVWNKYPLGSDFYFLKIIITSLEIIFQLVFPIGEIELMQNLQWMAKKRKKSQLEEEHKRELWWPH